MSITAEAVITAANFCVLAGIFVRIGAFGKAIQYLESRVSQLEDRKT